MIDADDPQDVGQLADLTPSLGRTEPTEVDIRMCALDIAARIGGMGELDDGVSDTARVVATITRAEALAAWIRRGRQDDDAIGSALEHVRSARQAIAQARDELTRRDPAEG